VYAFRREAEQHERYAAWLAQIPAGEEELGLHDIVLGARLVTNRSTKRVKTVHGVATSRRRP